MSDREFLDYSGLGYYTDKYNDQVNNITGAEYDSTATYSIDDYCIHDNKVYKCIASIDTAEEWTEEHWTHVNVTDEIDKMDHNVDLITNTEETYGPSSLVTFESETDGAPIRKITADINPVQDLHGYSNPWPAGGGKNLVPMTTLDGIKAHNTSGTWNGADYSRGGITFTVLTDNAGNVLGFKLNGTSTAGVSIQVKGTDDFTLAAGSYYYTGVSQTSGGYDLNLRKTGTETDIVQRGDAVTLTLEEDTSFSSMYIWVNSGKTLTNAYVYPMIRLSSVTDATFAPYSNICPISGHTGAEVTRTGKNLFDVSSIEQGTINAYGADQSSSARVRSGFVNVCRALRYVLSIQSGYICDYVFFYNGQKSLINYIQLPSNKTFMTPDNCEYMRFTFLNINSATVTPSEIDEVQLEIGSTATDYEPYTGNQISVNWETEAGTVYGGTVTLNEDGSADVVSEWGARVLNGSEKWSPNTSYPGNAFFTSANDMKRATNYKNVILCDKVKVCPGFTYQDFFDATEGITGFHRSGYTGQNWLYVRVNGVTTATGIKEWLTNNPLQVCYQLATPVTYHFSNIGQLKTFLGTNNIFTNLNGDTTVTVGKYLSTITSYIDGTKSSILSLIAKDESSGKASTNYVANQFIIMNGKFYRVTTNVASGAAFVIGTNCVETTVGSQITALLNA